MKFIKVTETLYTSKSNNASYHLVRYSPNLWQLKTITKLNITCSDLLPLNRILNTNTNKVQQ